MTQTNAGRVADVILAAAAVGVAWYVIRTPALRRVVVGFGIAALTESVPAWLRREVGHAWVESRGARDMMTA